MKFKICTVVTLATLAVISVNAQQFQASTGLGTFDTNNLVGNVDADVVSDAIVGDVADAGGVAGTQLNGLGELSSAINGHFAITDGQEGTNEPSEENNIKVITIHKRRPVPVPHFVPYTVEKKIPYPVKVPIKVVVPKPYPVYIPKPYTVNVAKPVPYTVFKKVPYAVRYPVKVPFPQPYPVAYHKPVLYTVEDKQLGSQQLYLVPVKRRRPVLDSFKKFFNFGNVLGSRRSALYNGQMVYKQGRFF